MIRVLEIIYQTVNLARLIYRASLKIGRESVRRRVYSLPLSKLFQEVQNGREFFKEYEKHLYYTKFKI